MANTLRRSGMSYSEIKDKLGIPRSTLSNWFKDEGWSKDIAIKVAERHRKHGAMRLSVMNTVRGNRLRQLYEDACNDAVADFEDLKYHPLFLAGVMLYWAHGEKSSRGRFLVASSDWETIKIIKLFLENVCQLDKYRVWVLLDSKMPEYMCKKYWMSKCGFRYEDFGKSILIRRKGHRREAHYGVCNIAVSSAYLKSKILKWIELVKRDLIEEKYMEGIAGIV